ncbi:MAG: PAS domain-containing protein [Candidatus Cloacimonetes bacterium]|nr:PAS domain-containing protein [Candidatus Cloacimonadota bacterium]
MKEFIRKDSSKIAIVGLLIIACILLIYYFHFFLKTDVIFTHLFYIPIILASLWWLRKGIAVAVFLALILLISHILSHLGTPIWTDAARASMFLIVGVLVVVLNQERLMLLDKMQSYTDILEKQLEKFRSEIIELQEKQQAILNNINDVIIVMDNNLNITWANRIAVEQYGDILGKKCYESFEWLGEPCSDCTAKEAFMDGEVKSMVKDIVLKNGTQLNLIVTCSPIRDRDGTITSVVEIFHDISEYKWAEDEIRKLTDNLEHVIERTADLKEKYGELEHLNTLFVGREDRMLEFKQRISELEKEIEQFKKGGK